MEGLAALYLPRGDAMPTAKQRVQFILEQLPDDCRWQRGKAAAGSSLVEWPQWLLDHRARPSGRVGFATWKYWTKTSPLIESGLLGPVTVQVKQKVVLAGAKSNVIPSEASH